MTETSARTLRRAPVDHPGVPVPAHRRSWSAPWPDYDPLDITPPELREQGLADAAAWITDPCANPAQVPDWNARLANALVPFRFTPTGWPLNPTGRTGRAGRNLGRWGENPAADPIVVAGTGTDRCVLLIRRADTGHWALPGGMVDAGESAPAALVRELAEETGVDLRGRTPKILGRSYVADWRTSDHAWVCTTSALYELAEVTPAVAGDDATDAAWWPWHDDVPGLAALLEAHGGLYPAHRPLLETAARTTSR